MVTIQPSKETLEIWRTCRLGQLYRTLFVSSKPDSDGSSQLEMITEIISRRPFLEIFEIEMGIDSEIELAVQREEYERAAVFTRMKKHFQEHAYT